MATKQTTEQATASPPKTMDKRSFLLGLANTTFLLISAGYCVVFCLMLIRGLTVKDFSLSAITWTAWGVIIGGAPIALATKVGKTYQFRAWWTQGLLFALLVLGLLTSGMEALTLFNLPVIAVVAIIFFSPRVAVLQLLIALSVIVAFIVAKFLGVLPPIGNAEFLVNSPYRWGLRGVYSALLTVGLAYVVYKYVDFTLNSVKDLAILKEAIDESPDAFVMWDEHDRLFTSNRRYRDLVPELAPHLKNGVTFEETLRIGLQLDMYPEAKGREEAWIRDRLAVHNNPHSSLVLRLGDGRWMRICEARTSFGYLAGFRTDVTDLRVIQDLLQATLDSVSNAIITMSADYRLLNINAATVRMFGIQPEEAIDKSIWDLSPEANTQALDKFKEYWQTVDRKEPLQRSVTTTLQRRNGEPFAARVAMTALLAGGETLFVLAVVDLSTERLYKGNQQALSAALSQLDVGFFLFNDLDEAQFVNEQFTKLLGLNSEQISLQPGSHITQVLTKITLGAFDLRLSNDKSSSYRGLLKFYYDPEGQLHLTLSGRRLLLEGQKLEGGYTSLRLADVTEATEQAAQLEQATKLATLGEMATGIAHELNQPLNAIKLTAASALRRLAVDPENFKEIIGEKLERVIEQVDRATLITDHMRKSARSATEDDAQANILEVVENAKLLLESTLRLNGIEWRMAVPASLPDCHIHPVRLEQVLLNLFNNSRDAITEYKHDRGGHRWLSVTAERKNADLVALVIEDSGGGIPAEVIDRIFDPFYTTKAIGKGTGLGLSISHQIVTEAGGTMKVTNTQYGAQFTITLPASKDLASKSGS